MAIVNSTTTLKLSSRRLKDKIGQLLPGQYFHSSTGSQRITKACTSDRIMTAWKASFLMMFLKGRFRIINTARGIKINKL
jgi:hypothetical protein